MPGDRRRVDVIVIGAGAAGLSAARTLAQDGRTVTVVEARQRIGGRIHTIHDPAVALPIELGAEFIHGEAADTFAIVNAGRLVVAKIPDEHLRSRQRKLAPIAGYWERVSAAGNELARLAERSREGDRTVADALDRAHLPGETRELVADFVEGYHAADPEKISARFLASGEDEEADAGNAQFRIVSGYDAVVRWLASGLDPDRVDVRLDTIATDLTWKRGSVRLACRNGLGVSLGPFQARAAIVAVPHALIRARALRFEPELAAKQKPADRLEAGHVFKLVCRFREAFWEDEGFVRDRLANRSAEPAAICLLHAAETDVPTWWTMAPVRAPLLTGWAGGPKADSLLREDEGTRVERSLTALSAALAVPRRQIDDLLDGWWTHDWGADPWSRGAYTYPRAGGLAAQKALARPVEATLFFAGEATEPDQTGTVAGAIASGRRAARQLLRQTGTTERPSGS